MLILSTFNSDYLQTPALKSPYTPLLESLFEKFTTESIEIKYVNKNLIGELIGLKIKKLHSCAILFRLFDFLEADSIIDIAKIEEHLSLILKQIILIKQKSALPFIVFLCPSPEIIYNEELKKMEEKYIKELNNNKIHTLTLSNIKAIYSLKSFENPTEGETHIPYLPKFYSAMACLLARKLHAIKQKDFKAIAVDCDNTLWTGVAGENGSEGVVFLEHNLLLQEYLVKQQENGKIIFLCSKNDKQTVSDVFEQREAEMRLKNKHLSSHNKINWEPKSKNIKEFAKEFNLFTDSIRFIDDSPIEVNEVNQNLDVFCITMPQNLKEYRNHWGFDIDEHKIITETDKNRDALYLQAETKAALATQFNDPVEYLRSSELGQSIIVSKIDDERDMQTIMRVSQLSGKTNQFNTFSQPKPIEINEVKSIIISPTRDIFIGKIKDSFSSEDITAVAVTSLGSNSLIINRFFLSCRVFNRGMEYEILKHIAQFSLEKNKKYIKLNFKKSQKNNPASKFLNALNEEENPKSKYLFDKTKNHAWLHISLKFLLKTLDLYIDFSSFELNEESILRLSARKLASMDLDTIIRKTLNAPERVSIPGTSKLIQDNNKITEKYLIELKQMTSSLECISNQFFADNNTIKSITVSDTRINALCNHLLGDEAQDKSLVARGLDSFKATILCGFLFDCEKVMIPISKLLEETTTSISLADYVKQQQESSGTIAQNDNVYNQNLVSFQQQRIWLAEQQESAGNSSNYHMAACYKLRENLDIQHFKGACYELVRLYDAFGTTFFMDKHELKLSVLPPSRRKLYFKIKSLQKAADLEEAIKEEINVHWNMSSKSLIRFTVFKEQIEKNYYIFFHIHHAIFDAISLKNCLDTLSEIYQNSLGSNSLILKEFPPQYDEFIHYQQKKLKDEIYRARAYNFWENTLSKIETVTTLPSDQYALSKPATEKRVNRYTFTLSDNDLRELKTLAQLHSTTCFNVLNALFALLVASYTYQDKPTLITAINGRDGHPTFNKMIGFFVNLIVQQFDLKKDQNFDEYLAETYRTFLDSQEFQDIPFWEIQEILQKKGIKDILSSPAFIFQSYSIPKLELGQQIAELIIPRQPIIFDLRKTCRFGDFTLFAQENNGELNFVIEYAKDVFSQDFIERFAKNFTDMIRNVYKKPNQKLQEISVVCNEERNQLINLGQGPKLDFSGKISLISQFQKNVNKYPENIALCCCEQRLTYKEVDQQSTNLAHALIVAGVKPGNYVGIFLDPDHQFFIAILAILKVGAVFIPLSKENSNERLKFIIKDAKIKFFIVDDNREGLLDSALEHSLIIYINKINPTHLDKKLPLLDKNTDEFCVLYTSGSTGTPKGVVLREKGIFRVVESPSFIKVLPEDKVAQTANQAFDAAQLECWLAWNHGASLVIFDKKTLLNTRLFKDKLITENITHMWLTAGLFDSYTNTQPDIFNNLSYLMVGGDVVHKDTILKVLNFTEAPIIINGYGPTEASIFALTHTFNKQTINNYNSALIGLPINNTTVAIKTFLGELAPKGAIGELVIRGEGVAKGYLNSALDKDRFTGNLDNKCYHTGDLVKYTKDSQIMFMERIDTQQIKVNGNFVALEEIRNCLSRHPAVKQIEISLFFKNQIVAFYILKSSDKKFISNEEFQIHLGKSLPDYMFPKFYKKVDYFEVNSNGKLDKAQFKKFEEEFRKIQREESPPQTSNSIVILKIIQDELPLFPNNINENFNNFGCDSLTVMRIINRINLEFMPEIEKLFNEKRDNNLIEKLFHASDLYKNPTVQGLENILNKKLENKHKNGSLRILKNGDSNYPPIIFIHPAGGGLSCFDNLVRQLTFANICYGIEDPLLDSNQLKLLSMDQMAENYLAIIDNEVEGPFILAGYSFGGMLGLEIAVQCELRSENNHLLQVILFDTWMVSYANEEVKARLKQEVLVYCAQQRKEANIGENSSDMICLLEELCQHHQKIGFEFKPQKCIFTPIHLLKAVKFNEQFKRMNSQDKNNFLSDHIEKLEIREIKSTHFEMLKNSNENSLVTFFSEKVNEINEKEYPNKVSKLHEVDSVFFRPLSEVNDSKLSIFYHPKVK